MSDHTIPAIDMERLAKALGFDHINPALIEDWKDGYAARVLTDSHDKSAEVAIANARAWIHYAYEKGREEGAREERREWEQKIRRLFGVNL